MAAALQSAFTRPAVAPKAFRGTPLKKNVAVASRGIKRVTAMKVNKRIKLAAWCASRERTMGRRGISAAMKPLATSSNIG